MLPPLDPSHPGTGLPSTPGASSASSPLELEEWLWLVTQVLGVDWVRLELLRGERFEVLVEVGEVPRFPREVPNFYPLRLSTQEVGARLELPPGDWAKEARGLQVLVKGLFAAGLLREIEGAFVPKSRARFLVPSQSLFYASHELLTPMNSILGFTKRLLKRLAPELGERDREALETVDRNARQLLKLFEKFLSASPPPDAERVLSTSVVELSQWVRQISQDHRSLFLDSEHQLSIRVPPTPLWGRVDPVGLHQILSNLLSNARKYALPGMVEVGLGQGPNQEVQIWVEDRGPGISKAEQTLLFERFQRGSYPDRVPGVGLGLSICSEIAHRHQGRMELTSEIGKGSRFAVVLPAEVLCDSSGGAS